MHMDYCREWDSVTLCFVMLVLMANGTNAEGIKRNKGDGNMGRDSKALVDLDAELSEVENMLDVKGQKGLNAEFAEHWLGMANSQTKVYTP